MVPLPKQLELLRLVLTPEHQRVADIYRRLGWTRKQLEQVINTHWAALGPAGIHVHVATKDAASGRKEHYIEVDGTCYSAISRTN